MITLQVMSVNDLVIPQELARYIPSHLYSSHGVYRLQILYSRQEKLQKQRNITRDEKIFFF